MNYRVIATTTFSNGVSYDALMLKGKRRLIHGDVCKTADEAMANLLKKIK